MTLRESWNEDCFFQRHPPSHRGLTVSEWDLALAFPILVSAWFTLSVLRPIDFTSISGAPLGQVLFRVWGCKSEEKFVPSRAYILVGETNNK